MSAGLELQALGCVRGGRVLFKGLDASILPGELLRVQGANGAGKTSLLRTLCGLLLPAQGQVSWRGQPIQVLREDFSRDLIYVGHAAALKDDLSALENLRTGGALGGREPAEREALNALAAAGLRGRERVPSRILSQGQKRRAGLARLALDAPPPLWVLDEPFNALDTAANAWLLGLIGAHLARGGIVVLTSHQPVALDDAVTQVAVTL